MQHYYYYYYYYYYYIIISGSAALRWLWPPRYTRFLNHPQRRATVLGLLWTCDHLVAETSTWQHTTHSRQTFMPPVGFKPTIAAGERPYTYALDGATTGAGNYATWTNEMNAFQINPLMSNDLWRRRKISHLQIKIPSKKISASSAAHRDLIAALKG
jgi:hypothetical protein